MKNGTIANLYQGNSDNIHVGDTVYLYGVKHNSMGTIQHTNVTAIIHGYDKKNFLMKNHILANYDSMGGDSGGTVAIIQNDNLHIVGMHTGHICKFTDSAGQSYGNATGSQRGTVCTILADDAYQLYTGFTAWNLIKNEFNIP